MKELNTFRQFLNEGKKKSERAKFVSKMQTAIPNLAPGLREGTWALGSVAEMALALGELEKIRKMGRMKGSVEINKRDDMFYNVFGDDSFHDALDAAKMATDDDTYNNMIGDAQARGIELYNDEIAYRKERGETGTEFKPRFGLEENDKVLDEIIDEGFLDRIKAQAKGAVAGAKATVANIKGDKAGGIKDAAQAAKIKSVIGDLSKDLQDAKNNLDKLIDPKDVKNYTVGQTGYNLHVQLNNMLIATKQMVGNLDKQMQEDVNENEGKEEVNESIQMFREIDDMLSRAAIHMDGEDFANELIQEFEVIPGAAKILHQALKNLMANNGIPEADPEEDQKIINKRNNV